ncbi:HpcH/HpaI aldolase family protein [Pseudomonas auratipiscis]|uniref:Aldolase/citrate lyase family protein n=1 Tax=Pseudomonas auratipiscis TaxID=3115853 RepID=A0AB35WP31_9PSED|nr:MULTISPECIES: aldolase/citrate lyase family protein [unclassified Pseudomonas]MEE1865860.1 aldolase/citrate lyase family protein [Pseudomonas sp. 120P]MEE1956971.1 aldolase/citrate lyase family protein [Pseudomonas sp. 119P]
MQPNKIKALWNEGKAVVNGFLSIPCAFVSELMAEQGYDALTIDLQHGIVDYQTAVSMLQSMRASGVAPMVRVPWLEAGSIMKALDAGAYGVVCPMINTAEQAARLVSYMRYPPVGVRSFGPTRASISAGADYGRQANENMLCFAMIETREAMDNLAEIAATPGLDGLYIGPADLTIGLTGMRYPTGFDREEPEMLEAIQHILATAHAHGIKAALHCGSPAYALRAIQWGFDMVTLANDVRMLTNATSAALKEVRSSITEVEHATDRAGCQY